MKVLTDATVKPLAEQIAIFLEGEQICLSHAAGF